MNNSYKLITKIDWLIYNNYMKIMMNKIKKKWLKDMNYKKIRIQKTYGIDNFGIIVKMM